MVTGSRVLSLFDSEQFEYQRTARLIFPILVRLAIARKTIFYSELDELTQKGNPRVFGEPLGCIGTTLEELSLKLGYEIPPIQCLVLNKTTDLPSQGIAWFLGRMTEAEFKGLTRSEKAELINFHLAGVYNFEKWEDILSYLEIETDPDDFEDVVSRTTNRRGGDGEGEVHKNLKRIVEKHPELVGFRNLKVCLPEYKLPSADSIDLLLTNSTQWLAVEVKPDGSDEAEITRGVFQCVKYRALLQAVCTASGSVREIDVCLAAHETVSARIRKLAFLLNVTLFDQIPRSGQPF